MCNVWIFGAPGRNRTGDLPLRRRPLYPLSYRGDRGIIRNAPRGPKRRGAVMA